MESETSALAIFVKTFCVGECTGISYVDSTPLRVCKNKRIGRHKVFKGIAEVGKSIMGWFYGFKLHLLLNEITGIKNNMKNTLVSLADKILLRKRSVIETGNDELKTMCQVEHSRHRSTANFVPNVLSVIAAYSFFPQKSSILPLQESERLSLRLFQP